MKAINTNEYIVKLIELTHKYEFPLEDVEAIPSIQEWCKKRGIEENNPFCSGKCIRNRETGNYKILLAEEITPEMQNSVISAMKIRGYGAEMESLENPSSFIVHLLLHEIAHARNADWSENECDSWAFGELEKIAI